MPKKGRDFPANLNFDCAKEIRQTVLAFSYLRGNGGSYASAARDLIMDGIRIAIESLDERKKRDFDEILENIKARDLV